MAIPISALLASYLLFQRLSRNSELTAMRASGLKLTTLLTPLLLCSILLSLANFSITAEIAPFCRRETKTLLYEETSQNPLLLLQRQKLVKIDSAYLDMKIKDEGKEAKDVILIAQNNKRLNLTTAKKLSFSNDELIGTDVAMVSHLPSVGFDTLIIENQATLSTAAPALSNALKKHRPRLDANSLELRLLLLRTQEEGRKAKAAWIDIFRRVSLALAVFTFTFIGCAFGIEQGRNPSKKGLLIAAALALFLLTSYLFGKELKQLPILIFLSPHVLIWIACTMRLRTV